MSIKAVLIDDEANNNESLNSLIGKYCPTVKVVGMANNIESGVLLINETLPEIVFLDVEMPFGNGFDLLNKLAPINFAVIFVTAFDKYAINAIKYSALDYILKPVDIQELKAAVEKAISNYQKTDHNKRVDNLLFNMTTRKSLTHKVALSSQQGLLFENVENIICLNASGNYTIVYTNNNRKLLITKTLKEFEDLLPEDFFCRIHHSFIINLNYIKKYFKGRGGIVEMENGLKIEVSARKKSEFLSKFSK